MCTNKEIKINIVKTVKRFIELELNDNGRAIINKR